MPLAAARYRQLHVCSFGDKAATCIDSTARRRSCAYQEQEVEKLDCAHIFPFIVDRSLSDEAVAFTEHNLDSTTTKVMRFTRANSVESCNIADSILSHRELRISNYAVKWYLGSRRTIVVIRRLS